MFRSIKVFKRYVWLKLFQILWVNCMRSGHVTNGITVICSLNWTNKHINNSIQVGRLRDLGFVVFILFYSIFKQKWFVSFQHLITDKHFKSDHMAFRVPFQHKKVAFDLKPVKKFIHFFSCLHPYYIFRQSWINVAKKKCRQNIEINFPNKNITFLPFTIHCACEKGLFQRGKTPRYLVWNW